MIVVMKRTATAAEIDTVVKQVETMGYKAHLSQGTERTIIGVVGDDRPIQSHNFEMLAGRGAGRPHPPAVQACEPGLPSG